METRTLDKSVETIDCQTCGQTYTAACDYRQGRCPHHPPQSAVKIRFQNLLRFFKGK
jgi:hypothetical protein